MQWCIAVVVVSALYSQLISCWCYTSKHGKDSLPKAATKSSQKCLEQFHPIGKLIKWEWHLPECMTSWRGFRVMGEAMLLLFSTNVHPSNLCHLPWVFGVHLCKCIGILDENMFRIGEATTAVCHLYNSCHELLEVIGVDGSKHIGIMVETCCYWMKNKYIEFS